MTWCPMKMLFPRLDAKDVQKELIEPAVKGTEAAKRPGGGLIEPSCCEDKMIEMFCINYIYI